MFTIATTENVAGEIAANHLTHVDRNASVFEASRLMRNSGATELLVTRETNGRVLALGVVTAGDFVTRVIAAGLDPAVLTTGDIALLHVTEAGGSASDNKNGYFNAAV